MIRDELVRDRDGLARRSCLPGHNHRPGFCEQVVDRGLRLGPSEVVALPAVHAEGAEGGSLFKGFDPFGGDQQPEIVGEDDDGADDRQVRAGPADAGNKGSVDLDRVDGDVAQVAERGVAGAEVVDRQADTEGAQVGQRRQR